VETTATTTVATIIDKKKRHAPETLSPNKPNHRRGRALSNYSLLAASLDALAIADSSPRPCKERRDDVTTTPEDFVLTVVQQVLLHHSLPTEHRQKRPRIITTTGDSGEECAEGSDCISAPSA